MASAVAPAAAKCLAAETDNRILLSNRVTSCFVALREPIYRFLICSYCWPHAEAEEVVQEVFLRMYRDLHSGKIIDNDRSWAYAVARNVALKSRRRDKYSAPSLSVLWDELNERIADTKPTSEEQLLIKERAYQLEAAVLSLTKRQLQCLQLRAEGLRYREIAEALDISLSGAVEAIELAVAKLRKRIREGVEPQAR
jgi:RNA polymerase sigma-70 factor (ECF subfamily)